MSAKRVEWIDIAKGLGMILVIIGHCVVYGGVVHNIIFSFHMPLFFILSGLVYKDMPVKTIINKRVKSLIWPYILFCIIGVLLAIIFKEFSFKLLLKDLFYGNPVNIYVSSCWFLVSLFVTSVFFSIILKLKNKKYQYAAVLLILFVGVGFAVLFQHRRFPYRLPLDIDVSFVSLFFFSIGFYFKPLVNECISKYKSFKVFTKIFFLSIIVIAFMLLIKLNGTVNLNALNFRNPILYVIESIVGSILLIFISMKLSGKKISGLFIWIGQNSLYILGAQAIGVRLFLKLLNYILNVDYKLYGLPYSWAVLSFIFTSIFSILFVVIKNKIGGFSNKKIEAQK